MLLTSKSYISTRGDGGRRTEIIVGQYSRTVHVTSVDRVQALAFTIRICTAEGPTVSLLVAARKAVGAEIRAMVDAPVSKSQMLKQVFMAEAEMPLDLILQRIVGAGAKVGEFGQRPRAAGYYLDILRLAIQGPEKVSQTYSTMNSRMSMMSQLEEVFEPFF